jgi:hypothetical protein
MTWGRYEKDCAAMTVVKLRWASRRLIFWADVGLILLGYDPGQYLGVAKSPPTNTTSTAAYAAVEAKVLLSLPSSKCPRLLRTPPYRRELSQGCLSGLCKRYKFTTAPISKITDRRMLSVATAYPSLASETCARLP